MYLHRSRGWIRVTVVQVDHRGAEEPGGATYTINAPEIGVIETVRERLRTMDEFYNTSPDSSKS